MDFIDRVHKYMFNDGLLTPENNRSRWSRLQSLLDKAIVAESALGRRPSQSAVHSRAGLAQGNGLYAGQRRLLGQDSSHSDSTLSQGGSIPRY